MVDKLRKEIEQRWQELADKNVKVGGGKYDAQIETYLSVLSFLDTLQELPSNLEEAAFKSADENADCLFLGFRST